MRNREREIAQANKNNIKKITNDSTTPQTPQTKQTQKTPQQMNKTYSSDDIEKLLLIM
jgi:hypothetical protein